MVVETLPKGAGSNDVADAALEEASAAGLRYVRDADPGIRRLREGDGFIYQLPTGERLTDEREIQRIKRLAIPPAWTDVWICTRRKGHLQATGRDARGRKQYRYHPDWRASRDATKFDKLVPFAGALPALRERVAQDAARSGLPRAKVLATIAGLLETTLIRVGNPEYTRDNGSFGLTTLRDEHVNVSGSSLRFDFVGKSGKRHKIHVRSARLAKIVRRLRDLPGQELFQYIDDDGDVRAICSQDVNEYLREAMGGDFTAKDFRTWQATVLAASLLARAGTSENAREAKKMVTDAVALTAERLGNTPTICRKSYVHPAIIDAYFDGVTIPVSAPMPDHATDNRLTADERSVLRLLRQRETSASTATAALAS